MQIAGSSEAQYYTDWFRSIMLLLQGFCTKTSQFRFTLPFRTTQNYPELCCWEHSNELQASDLIWDGGGREIPKHPTCNQSFSGFSRSAKDFETPVKCELLCLKSRKTDIFQNVGKKKKSRKKDFSEFSQYCDLVLPTEICLSSPVK